MVAQAFTVDLDKPLVFQVNVTMVSCVFFFDIESTYGILVLCFFLKRLWVSGSSKEMSFCNDTKSLVATSVINSESIFFADLQDV
jgi:hypothetical protein